MEEIWKPVKNYEDSYMVSNTGKIKSIKSNKEVFKRRISKSVGNKDGYIKCRLFKKGIKPKQYYLHKLIAEVFIPNPESKPQVDHINGDSLDNNVYNLRWVTQKENNTNPNTRKAWFETKRKSSNKIYTTQDGKSFKLLSECAKYINKNEYSLRYHINRYKNNNRYKIKIKTLQDYENGL